jgi:hypothetical protein
MNKPNYIKAKKIHSTMAIAIKNTTQSRCVAEKENNRNTITPNTTRSTFIVPVTPQLSSLSMNEDEEDKLSDTRHKGKSKTLKISLINTETRGEKSSSFTLLYKNKNNSLTSNTILLPVVSLFLTSSSIPLLIPPPTPLRQLVILTST